MGMMTMRVQSSWWIDGGLSLDQKLNLRKKLAEFLQVEIAGVNNGHITGRISVEQLPEVVLETLSVLNITGPSWIWIAIDGDKNIINKKALAGEIVNSYNYSVYSFTASSYNLFVKPSYQKWKEEILAEELPTFCLDGMGSLHDGKPKVFLIFAQQSYHQKLILHTKNIRYGYIMELELKQDSKLTSHIHINVMSSEDRVLLDLTTSSPEQMERAVAIVFSKARNFKLAVTYYTKQEIVNLGRT